MIDIKYPGYTVAVPENLSKPFKLLSCILEHQICHPMELLSNDMTSELVDGCLMAAAVSIGAAYAGSNDMNSAVTEWRNQGRFEQLMCVVRAAKSTQPYSYAEKMLDKSRADAGD